ncbi:MAG: hypothetical protein NT062_38330, partial [Proteobacteria bacterium]|nr:hypothetical protein [Pseudomonadota bacterium]
MKMVVAIGLALLSSVGCGGKSEDAGKASKVVGSAPTGPDPTSSRPTTTKKPIEATPLPPLTADVDGAT